MEEKKLKFKKFVENATPLAVAVYFFLVSFGVFFVTKIFGEGSTIITLFKAFVFILFFGYLLFVAFKKRISINHSLIDILIICVIASLIATIITPTTKNVISIARDWTEILNYTGYDYRFRYVTIRISFFERLTSLVDTLLFASCIFIFGDILPKILNTKEKISKTLYYVCIVVALTGLFSFATEAKTIIESLKNISTTSTTNKLAQSVFVNKNSFGLILLSGTIAANISMIFYNKNKYEKWIKIAIQIFLFVTSLATLCKTAILFSMIYYFAKLLHYLITSKNLTKKKKIVSFSILAGVTFLFLIFVFVPQFARLFGEKVSGLQEKLYYLFINYGKDTIESRKEAWRTVFQISNGSNIFIGFGDKICDKYFASATVAMQFWGVNGYTSTHNAYLYVYLQGGLIRIISYTLFLGFIITSLLKARKTNRTETFPITLVFIVFSLYAFFESLIFGYHDTLSIIISILCVSIPIALPSLLSEEAPEVVAQTSNDLTIEDNNHKFNLTFVKEHSRKVLTKIKSQFAYIKSNNLTLGLFFSFLFLSLTLTLALLGGFHTYAQETSLAIEYTLFSIVFLVFAIDAYLKNCDNNQKQLLFYLLASYIIIGIILAIINAINPKSIYNGYLVLNNISVYKYVEMYERYLVGYVPLIFVIVISALFILGVKFKISIKAIFYGVKKLCVIIKNYVIRLIPRIKKLGQVIVNGFKKFINMVKRFVLCLIPKFKKIGKAIINLFKKLFIIIKNFILRMVNKIKEFRLKQKEKKQKAQVVKEQALLNSIEEENVSPIELPKEDNNVEQLIADEVENSIDEEKVEEVPELLEEKQVTDFVPEIIKRAKKDKDNINVLVISHNALAGENANAIVLTNMLSAFKETQIAQLFIQNDIPTSFKHSRFYKITDKIRLKGFFSKHTHGEIVDATIEQELNVSKTKKRSKLSSFLSTSALGELIRESVWKHGGFDYKHLTNWIGEFAPDVIVFVPGRTAFLNDLTLKIAETFNIPVLLYTTEDEYFHPKKKINFFHNIMLNKLKKSYQKLVSKRVTNMVLIQDRLTREYQKEFNVPCETIMMASKHSRSTSPYQEKLLLYAGNVDRGRISTLLEISKQLEKIDQLLLLTVIPGGVTEKELKPLKERFNVRVLEFMPYEEYIACLKNAYVLFNVDSFEEKYHKITTETFTGKTADLLRMGRPLCVVTPKYLYTYEYFTKYSNCAMVVGNLNDLNKALNKVIFNEDYRKAISENAYNLSQKNHNLETNSLRFQDAVYKSYIKGGNYDGEN